MAILDMFLQLVHVQTILVGIAGGLIAYLIYDRMKYNFPPGPWCIPLIGNYEIYTSSAMHRDAAKLGPVVTVNFGPYRTVFLNNLDSVIEALVKKGADFASRPILNSIEILSQGGKDIAFGRYTATWKFQKKIAGKALRYYMQGTRLENMINDVGDRVIERMETEKEPFVAREYTNKLVIHMLYNMCFNRACDLDAEDVNEVLRLDLDIIEKFGNGFFEDLFPLMTKVYTTQRYKDCISTINKALGYLEKELQQHKETFDSSNIRDYTDSILLAREEAEAEEKTEQVLTDEHVLQIVSDILFAGLDTSRMTLDWFISYMTEHQDIQAKCHEEIDKAIGLQRPPSVEDRSSLPYTEACLMETMRLGSVAGLGVPHLTLCDTSVAGYHIPKDTTVFVNHWALHNDPIYWKDVEKFDPTRYLDKDGNMDKKPENWLPFSAGRRVCLGETVARAELLLFVTKLLQNFRFKAPPGVQYVTKAKAVFGSEEPVSYKVVVEKRK